jgi:hypothetical protein
MKNDFSAFSRLLTLERIGNGPSGVMRCKDFLIVLSGIVLWQRVLTVDVGELFRELNEEILEEKHQTAQIAWDTL